MNNKDEVTEDLLGKSSSDVAQKKPGKASSHKFIFIIIGLLLIAAALVCWFVLYPAYKENKFNKELELAQKYLDDGDYKNAVLAFKDAASISDRHPEIYPLLAESAVKDKDYATAHEAYAALIEMSDDKISPTIGEAEVYQAEGKYAEAYDSLKKLSADYPENNQVQYALSMINSGNLAGNVSNGGDLVASPAGMVYFIDNRNVHYIEDQNCVIYSYNENDPNSTPTELYSTNGQIDNLNLWNDQLYFYHSQGISDSGLYRINISGGDATKVMDLSSSDYRLYEGKIYSHSMESAVNGDGLLVYDLDGNRVGSVSLTGGMHYMITARAWTIANGMIYLVHTVDGPDIYMSLDAVDLNGGTPKELYNDYISSANGTIINGLYRFGNMLYYSFVDMKDNKTTYRTYNLDTNEVGQLNFGEDEGLSVNSEYAFLGSFYSKEVNVLSLKDNTVTKTIDISGTIPEGMGDNPPTVMMVAGFMVSPSRIYGMPSVFPANESHDTSTVVYSISFDDWSIKEVLKPV